MSFSKKNRRTSLPSGFFLLTTPPLLLSVCARSDWTRCGQNGKVYAESQRHDSDNCSRLLRSKREDRCLWKSLRCSSSQAVGKSGRHRHPSTHRLHSPLWKQRLGQAPSWKRFNIRRSARNRSRRYSDKRSSRIPSSKRVRLVKITLIPKSPSLFSPDSLITNHSCNFSRFHFFPSSS